MKMDFEEYRHAKKRNEEYDRSNYDKPQTEFTEDPKIPS